MSDCYCQKPVLKTILNKKGLAVTVMDWGAAITSIKVPVPGEVKPREILLGLKNAEDWSSQACYFNATIGRYANRIGQGRFNIANQEYVIAKEGRHALHGGLEGFDKRRFEFVAEGENFLILSLHSPDLDQGFPGSFNLKVTFTVTEDNSLQMEYLGTCDKPCPVCITNHAYFNLNGYNSSVLQHRLWLDSDKILELDEDSIPTGKVLNLNDHAAFDFRKEKTIAQDFMKHPQMQSCKGYDQPYLIKGDLLKAFARLTSEDGRLSTEFYSDYPACQVYSSNYVHEIKPIIARDDGREYQNQCAMCLEPEFYPDSPNLKEFTALNPLTEPDKPLKRTIAYKFICNQ